MSVTLAYAKFKLEQSFPTFSTCGLPIALHLAKKGYQWLSPPKLLGRPECLTLGELQYFCLGRRFSKHKMARYAKNVGRPCLPWLLYEGYVMVNWPTLQTGGKRETIHTLRYTILEPVKGWHPALTQRTLNVRQCDCSWRTHIWYTPVHPISVVHPWKILYTSGCTIHQVDKHCYNLQILTLFWPIHFLCLQLQTNSALGTEVNSEAYSCTISFEIKKIGCWSLEMIYW